MAMDLTVSSLTNRDTASAPRTAKHRRSPSSRHPGTVNLPHTSVGGHPSQTSDMQCNMFLQKQSCRPVRYRWCFVRWSALCGCSRAETQRLVANPLVFRRLARATFLLLVSILRSWFYRWRGTFARLASGDQHSEHIDQWLDGWRFDLALPRSSKRDLLPWWKLINGEKGRTRAMAWWYGYFSSNDGNGCQGFKCCHERWLSHQLLDQCHLRPK